MGETAATDGAHAAPARRGRVLNIVLWVLQVLLALAFLSAGFLKISGARQMVDMFAEIGVGQWLRYVIGALEIAGGIGVLIPLLSGLAATGLTLLMVGATLTNLFVIEESPAVPLTYLVMAAIVAWGRWPQTRALPNKLRRIARS